MRAVRQLPQLAPRLRQVAHNHQIQQRQRVYLLDRRELEQTALNSPRRAYCINAELPFSSCALGSFTTTVATLLFIHTSL